MYRKRPLEGDESASVDKAAAEGDEEVAVLPLSGSTANISDFGVELSSQLTPPAELPGVRAHLCGWQMEEAVVPSQSGDWEGELSQGSPLFTQRVKNCRYAGRCDLCHRNFSRGSDLLRHGSNQSYVHRECGLEEAIRHRLQSHASDGDVYGSQGARDEIQAGEGALPEPTLEQVRIMQHEPKPGEVVLVKAYAGTGKTTTAKHIIRTHPHLSILYVVFSKQLEREMSASPAVGPNVTVKTCHALAKARVFKPFHAHGLQPLSDLLDLDQVVAYFQLEQLVSAESCGGAPTPVNTNSRKYEKGSKQYCRTSFARKLAVHIKDTLLRFCRSADREVTSKHVPLASFHECFRERMFLPGVTDKFVVRAAAELWKHIDPRAREPSAPPSRRTGRAGCPLGGISHDAYLKLCQLYGDGFGTDVHWHVCPRCGPLREARVQAGRCSACRCWLSADETREYDLILVDESQDLSECEFALFARGIVPRYASPAGSKMRAPAVYFIGDEFQRIYGWRGASADAWSVSVRPYLSATYSLSASFRFGTSVAQLATQLLQFKGELGAVLEGRGPQADILSTAWREGTNPCEVEYQVEVESEDGTRVVGLLDLALGHRDKGPLTVICRTNLSICKLVLLMGLSEEPRGRIPAWHVSGWKDGLRIGSERGGGSGNSSGWQHRLSPLVCLFHDSRAGVDGAYRRGRQTFHSWVELKEYVEQNVDTQLMTDMELVQGWEGRRVAEQESESMGECARPLSPLPPLLQMVQRVEAFRCEGESDCAIQFITSHKAKGREFPVVLLANDFNGPYLRQRKADNKHAAGEWRLLTVNEISAGQRWREETNLLYVAITRAQRALILNRQLSRFFRHRDERRLALPTSDEAGCEVQGHPENVGIVPEGDMQEVRLAEEAVWEHWDAQMTALLARGDVNVEVDEQLRRAPFPRDPQGNELLLHPSMEADHVRRYLRALSLRWHPDKWAARLARASQGVAVWVQGELQRVMAIVGKTMREHSPDGRDGPNRI